MHDKKHSTREKIVRELYFNNSLSCADLSLKIKKSLPVTTRIVSELIDDGWIREMGFAPSTGGRRPGMYSLKSDVSFIVCVAMDQFVVRIAVMDMQNNMVSTPGKFELSLPKNQGALTQLTEIITGYLKEARLPKKKLLGIGIGMPGFVDYKNGINYSFLETTTGTVTEHISRVTGLPVFIDNDSSLIALAELRFGAAKNKNNAMVINLGWGLGLGMILNAELFRGHDGFAGEFSHIPVFSNDKMCSCGKSGCLETETSLLVIIDQAKRVLELGRSSMTDISFTEDHEEAWTAISRAVHAGDRFIIELFSKVGYNIGRGVAILIHLLNPELIILSGRGSVAGKVWLAPIQQALNEHCIPRIAANTSLVMSTLGHDAELVGAAALVMENFQHKQTDKNNNKEIAIKSSY
ncbi:ROK family transcriptional regulator [Segetibacter sp. 3557_3]|uniref:ROK family transcriptional regulator n=1 Tax=Segetibacter sp. 3557_3 TaxID=2547429 RepID=UPI0010588186|nr:ROK family transcriptional regulator [Segetibacter sp. 3557_3]TDH28609.1 ROK family transcriptional regulator [Segetibacter sp. 3557_3]